MIFRRIYRILSSMDPLLASASPILSFSFRVYVAWQFLKSGLLKIGSWESTLYLFRHEYDVPLLDSEIAAIVGTASELVLPLILIVGLLTRMTGLALFAFNVVAVISYSHVLAAPGNAAALGSHILWGALLLVPIFYGGERLSLDHLIRQRLHET